MTTPHPRSNSVGAGGSEWAALLAECIDAIPSDDFPRKLVDALKSLADFDHSVVFAYYQREKPLCLAHDFSNGDRAIFVDDYLKGPYLLDPFFKACSRQVDPGLYRLRDVAPDRFYQGEYYRSYYERTGLAEEICFTFYLERGVACVISLMRSGESSKFSAREFRLLAGASPIVLSLGKRHWQDVPESFDTDAAAPPPAGAGSQIEDAVGSLFGRQVTPRETQVIAQVLEGHSSEAIARSLSISVGTVRIHRRNIYAKLRISSQQELFSMFFQKITRERV